MRQALGATFCLLDPSGKPLPGEALADVAEGSVRIEAFLEEKTLGFVVGPAPGAAALASLIAHLAGRENDGRALASEVLHLYREINVIEQLSEQLAPLLALPAIGDAALAQAQRLIPSTHGSILVMETALASLQVTAAFGDAPENETRTTPWALGPDSRFAASVLERGMAEIVNDCAADPRALDVRSGVHALICAPLRAGQRTVGVIALANKAAGAAYSAANLKLLNTIALQTAAAIENALLCSEMVETARERAAFAAEFQAASTVQQLLMQSASRSTPGFHVDSVYLPASEVGGDFFLVSPAPGGSLTAIVGDVSGKGLTAAMRVSMILGALRRETSYEPDSILSSLNNSLISQDQLGFTTACCVRISPEGEYCIANAGHIAPYIAGIELETPAALPLGLIPNQSYELVSGTLLPGQQLVLMSDGVPEARTASGELYGFERLASLTFMPAQQIAEAAQRFGQEDDITVLTLTLGSDERVIPALSQGGPGSG